jgi:hypothetical protein
MKPDSSLCNYFLCSNMRPFVFYLLLLHLVWQEMRIQREPLLLNWNRPLNTNAVAWSGMKRNSARAAAAGESHSINIRRASFI